MDNVPYEDKEGILNVVKSLRSVELNYLIASGRIGIISAALKSLKNEKLE